jgi:hypothetical protein
LVAACILENTAHLFEDAACDGIHRDDGLAILSGNWSKHQIIEWPEKFQKEVSKVTKCEGLQFTISIWGAEKKDCTTHDKKVMVEPTDYLPFLDMKLYWDNNKNITFTVY